MQERAFVGVAKATSHVVAEKKVKRSPLYLAQVDVFLKDITAPKRRCRSCTKIRLQNLTSNPAQSRRTAAVFGRRRVFATWLDSF